jgi:carotenoid cleavage dioxygenase
MARARLALGSGVVTFEQLDALMAEFPRIDDRRIGRKHRYFHVVGKHAPIVGEWDHLRRYDTVTGSITTRDLGARRLGEAIFAPGGSGTGEDDGYLLVYTYDPAALTTDLLILHAGDVAGEPAATLRMPHRVPFGLHGNWVAVA